MMPKLSIIIVTWNCWDYVIKCIKSVRETTGRQDYEIIIVDSHSRDPVPDELNRLDVPVKLICQQRNVGFSKGNNIGFKEAQGELLLALNPDTVVHEGAIQRAIEFLDEHPDYACVGVKTLKPNGRIQLSCVQRFPTPWRMICNVLMLDKIFRFSELFGGTEMPYWDHQNSCDVDMVSGAFMMFRRSVYDSLGGFDETIPMYVDDMEFCIRLRGNGMKIRYLADASIIHYIGVSARKAEPRWMAELRCEAMFMTLTSSCGRRDAEKFVYALIFAYLIKLLIIPILAIGKYCYNGEWVLAAEYGATLTGWSWAMRKIRDFDVILSPQGFLPEA